MAPQTPAWARFTPGGPDEATSGIPALLIDFGRELRSEGMSVGTSEMLDAVAALGEVDWNERDDFREALAQCLAVAGAQGQFVITVDKLRRDLAWVAIDIAQAALDHTAWQHMFHQTAHTGHTCNAKTNRH